MLFIELVQRQFYQQTDGVTMGGPASPITTEIYMQAHEQSVISTTLHPLKVWEQFVDNVYSQTYAF